MPQQLAAVRTNFNETAKRIRKTAADTAAHEVLEREHSRRENIRHAVNMDARLRKRIAQALLGIRNLVTLGSSPEFQKLADARNASYVVWGDRTSLTYSSHVFEAWIRLTQDAVELECSISVHGKSDDSFLARFPYTLDDEFLMARRIAPIATFDRPQGLLFDVLRGDLTSMLTTDIIFEELMHYATDSYLEQRFKVGQCPFELIVDDEVKEWRDTEERYG